MRSFTITTDRLITEVSIDRPQANGPGPIDDLVQTARRYWRSAGRKQLAHYIAAEHLAARNRLIGIPSVIFSTIVATSVFSTLTKEVDPWIKILTALIAVMAAVSSALMTFFAFGDRAEKHRVTGARFGKVRGQIDVLQLKCAAAGFASRDEALAELQKVGDELGALEADSPTLSARHYAVGKSRFDDTHPER